MTPKENFLKRATKSHGNKFDYSKANYKNNKTKITIICPVHGEYQQFPQTHIKGKGCPKCHLDTLRKTTKQFIIDAKAVHGNKYDYSKSKYVGALEKITITCPIHGDFEQSAADHTSGKKGCIKCGRDNITKSLDDFKKQSHSIHGGKYDYSLISEYTSNMNKVKIICPDHGVFEQRPYCHTIKQQGCPECPVIISKPQQDIINYVESIFSGDIKINDRKIIGPNELGIYIPEKHFAIEYNGLFWHSYDNIESSFERKKHQFKTDKCDDLNINLFQIWEHEWAFKKKLIKSMINGKLGLNNKVYARKCSVKELSSMEYKNFCDKNHLQGKTNNPIRYGLFYENELLCVAGFIRHKTYEWELGRFASKMGISVIGGASRLLKHFIKNHSPKQILSYASRNHSNGNMYQKLGFSLVGKTPPGYQYYKNGIIYSRQQFQKHKLKQKLKIFDDKLSEAQNMFNNGYRRFWNSGNLKFLLVNNH